MGVSGRGRECFSGMEDEGSGGRGTREEEMGEFWEGDSGKRGGSEDSIEGVSLSSCPLCKEGGAEMTKVARVVAGDRSRVYDGILFLC